MELQWVVYWHLLWLTSLLVFMTDNYLIRLEIVISGKLMIRLGRFLLVKEWKKLFFFQYLNNLHASLKYNMEMEEKMKLSFRDVLVERTSLCFLTTVYRKPNFDVMFEVQA